MSSERIRYAMDQGALELPDGPVALFGAPADAPLSGIDPSQVTVIQRDAVATTAWQAHGVTVRTAPEGRYACAIVTLPRARDLAEAWLAEAAAHADLLVIDGAKTDGIESIAKAVKKRTRIDGQVSKAHGKCLWLKPGDALADWSRPDMHQNAEGDWVAPGVFSADAADPASRALAQALPAALKGHAADLGAGWGWLSREILAKEGVKTLHLVESDHAALSCARRNLDDSRAVYHWADATDWTPPAKLDCVVMNPPFHIGRKADPALGRAFIETAARALAPHGQLYMVANRHLPYETTLAELFRETAEIGGDNRFKLLHATRPIRTRR
ncbi:class I SAM-dependent methyltransferase [Sagittula sp. SSi028]|uniref:class I SAM-dependent methyltransferase n=1 Tax=Sagittula sp. SSi028 TaxID=3400636 RepID=UPI003AF88447